MRLSIWQQYSSNHSGAYFVVGIFATNEDALHAENELKDMLRSIDVWHRANPHAAEHSDGSLFPPEREAAEKYHAEWPQSIEWTNWADYYLEGHPSFPNFQAAIGAAANIEESLSTAANALFAHNPDQTWMTMQPFKSLIEYFGAETIGFDFEHSAGWETCFFRVTGTAPEETTAQKLHQLPASIELTLLTVERDGCDLTYEFQLPTEETVREVIAVLKSNQRTNIHIDLFQKT
jgi:hypothetical protein